MSDKEKLQQTCKQMIEMGHESKISQVCKEFEISRSTIVRWSEGGTEPLNSVAKQVLDFIVNIYAW